MRNTRHPAGGRRKADAYLRQVMDGLGPHMFVGVMTVDGTLVEANRPALAAAGLALEDVLGKPFDETYWWSYAEPVQRQLRAAIARAADGIASRYDVQVRAADGQMIDIDFSLQPLRDEAGAVALLVPSAVVITDRKRSERALRESEATFARILEAIPSGVVLVSPTGDITLANAAAERLAGVAPGGMAGRRFDDPVWQFFSMDGRPVPDDQRLFTRVLRTGQPQYGAEMAARRGDGTTLILSINAAPMYDAEGTLAGVVGAFRDITDRKRAEEALRGSEERLRLALDAARMGTFDWDIPYSRITWSRRHEELWGLPPGGFDGSYEAFAAGVHPGDLPRVNAAIAECIAARSGFQLEFRVVWPDGSVRSILARGAFTFDATGRPARMTGVAMDTTEQHAAMDALRESEERLRLFIEHAPAALAMFDRDMRYLAASRRWLADYRLGQRDVIGRSHYDVFPEIPERWRLVHGRGMAGETVRSDEDAFERADGTVQYLRWEVRPWHAADGAVGGIVIFTEDISDRKRTEAAMRRGAARLRLALDAALMGIFDWDVPHNRITWSRRHEALWGFAPGEFAGTYEAFASRVHPGDLPGVNEEVARCIAARAPFNREFRVVWPDGSVHWVSGRGEFEFDAGGQPRRMRGVTVEVTARRLADEALRESRERLARIVATDASGIVVVDTSGTITLANPAVERMAGLLPGSMAGRSASEVAPGLLTLDGEPIAEDARPFAVAMRTGPVHGMEVALDRPDGRRIALSVNAAPLLNEDGTTGGVVATLSDITEHARANARLRDSAAALRALSERLAVVREEESARIARELHDELGQALTGLKMDLSWIDRRLGGLEDQEGAAPLLEKSASMLRLLDATVQTVRRIATDLRPGLIDDLGLAAAIEWQAADFARRSGIGCAASVPADLPPPGSARAVALYRILQEALTNVVRHAGARQVHVTLACDGAALRLDVQDDGCGIGPGVTPSSRALGLLGMHERARVFGGTVTVWSTAPHGTLVRAEIPL